MTRGLPTGTITFCFTDIEGSTRLVQALGDRWKTVIEEHDALLRTAIETRGGVIVRTEGDAVFAVFDSATAAVEAMVAAQRSLAGRRWPDDAVVRVRIGLHTGVGALGGGDYVGLDVHRAARVAAAGHGGQILLSETTAPLVDLPEGVVLQDLGKHRLKDLNEAETLFQLRIAGLPADFGPLRTLERVSNNLPVQVTSFVGRDAEIAAALDLLARCRILTLTGPGGTGKTRLALQVAAESSERFPDGVYFVSLADVTDPELVAPSILGAIGAQAAGGVRSPLERLGDLLADRSVLLLLDNFEQVVAAAPVVGELARRSPGSGFLVTSRVPLRLMGEQEYPVPPLGLGEETIDVAHLAEVPAVRLLVERAMAIDPRFAVTEANATAVEALVRRLDGLPLAIELIAPRLRLLSVEAVLERLDLGALGGGGRDLPERHRSLASAIAWSEELLPPRHRDLFHMLAVFSGGARLGEIEAVVRGCDPALDVVEGLGALAEASLVRRAMDGEDRFEMLTVIREHASHGLTASGRRGSAEAAHARAYLGIAETVAPTLLGRERRSGVERMEREHDNLRAALTHYTDGGHTDEAQRLVAAMWRFWQMGGHLYEARRRIDAVLALGGGSPACRSRALEASGGISWWQGDLERCSREYAEALDIQRGIDDPAALANALYNLGIAGAFSVGQPEGGDADRWAAMLRESEDLYARLGDRRGLGDARWGLGNIENYARNDLDAALRLFESAAADYAAAGSVFGEGWCHFEIGYARYRLGHLDAAASSLGRGLRLLWDSRDESAVVLFVMGIAAVALAGGDRDRAHRLAGAAWALRDRSGLDIISLPENAIAGLERESLEAAGTDSYREGLRLTTAQAVSLALSEA